MEDNNPTKNKLKSIENTSKIDQKKYSDEEFDSEKEDEEDDSEIEDEDSETEDEDDSEIETEKSQEESSKTELIPENEQSQSWQLDEIKPKKNAHYWKDQGFVFFKAQLPILIFTELQVGFIVGLVKHINKSIAKNVEYVTDVVAKKVAWKFHRMYPRPFFFWAKSQRK